MPEDFKFILKSNTFVVIDWANVYGWFSDHESKKYLGWEINPKKLFEYLKLYPEISEKNINLYYGVESSQQKSIDFKNEVEEIGYDHKSKEVKWVPAALETTAHFKPLVRKLFDVLDSVKNTNSEISNKLYELSKKVNNLPKISIGNANEDKMFRLDSKNQLDEIYNLIEDLDNELKKLNIDIGDLQEKLRQPVRRRKCDFDVEISRDIYNNLGNFNTLILFSGDGDYEAIVKDLILKGKKVIVVYAFGHFGREYDELIVELTALGIKNKPFLCPANNLRKFIAK
jgi:uncharacterized LabA/DUF88 family protein